MGDWTGTETGTVSMGWGPVPQKQRSPVARVVPDTLLEQLQA